MEPVILLTAFIGTNIWGIFGPVPFTNINPTRTFLDRFLGSVQVTSTIWALQEIHPKVFPEVLLEGPRRETIGPQASSSFITPKTQEVFKTVTDFVNMMTTQSAEDSESVAQSTSLVLVPRESARPKTESVFPLKFGGVLGYTAVVYVVIGVLILSVFVWNVRRRARRGPKRIELDAALLTQLVGALKEEFKYRIPGQDDEDVNAITRRANIAGILDMVEIPPATHLENNPPTVGALIDVSQRVTRLEELLKMIFPYTAPDGDVSGNAPSDTQADGGPETAGQDAGQGRMAARKAKFHQTMREIDEGMRDYNRIATELETIKIAMKGEAAKQEWAAKDIKELRDELGRLYAAMVCITEDGVDNRLVLSEDEKSDSHRYTDVKVQRSNVVWQAKYTELADRLDEQNRKMESSMLSEVPLIKKRQSDGFMFLNKKIEDFRIMPSRRLFSRDELVGLMENILTRNPTIQALIQRANATKKAIGTEGERIQELKSKIDYAGHATAFLTAENAKVWEVLGTTAESSKGATRDNNEGSHASKSSEASRPANPAVESNAPFQPTTPSREAKKGKKPRSPNLYDAETDPESDENEENDEDDDPQAESIAQLPSADEGPSCNVVGGSIDEEVLAAQREFTGLDDSRSGKPQDKGQASTAPARIQFKMENLAEKPEQPAQSAEPQEKGQTSTAPQTSTSPQMPKPPRRPFDPSAYGLKKHMEKISPQTPAGPLWKKPPPKPQVKPPVKNGLWPAGRGRGGIKPPSLPHDPSTKKDYQPETPKTQSPDQKKGPQGRGQHMSRGGHIGQNPPPRQSATAEEQKKLQSWSTFAQTALVKEREEEKKILAEAKTDTNQKTVAWTANEIWKPKNAPTEETEAEAGGAGRRRSEPNLGRELASGAQTEAEVEGPGLEASVHAIPGATVRRADGKKTSVPPRRNSAGQ